MARRIRVRGIPRSKPDVRLYALALIELARQLQAEGDTAGQHGPPPASAQGGGPEDGAR